MSYDVYKCNLENDSHLPRPTMSLFAQCRNVGWHSKVAVYFQKTQEVSILYLTISDPMSCYNNSVFVTYDAASRLRIYYEPLHNGHPYRPRRSTGHHFRPIPKTKVKYRILNASRRQTKWNPAFYEVR